MNNLENALWLFRKGLNVLPAFLPGEEEQWKRPRFSWLQWQEERVDEEKIREWFTETDSNISVVTGAISGVVVVDADSEEVRPWILGHLPYTPWQVRTSRGFHLYYRHPGKGYRTGNRCRIQPDGTKLKIDVRGDGGQVLGPGSVHESGVIYEALGNWGVSRHALPPFETYWITPPRLEEEFEESERKDYFEERGESMPAVERARRWLSKKPRPEIGQGSDEETFTVACFLTRDLNIPFEDAVEILWEWAGGRDGWTRHWVRGKVVGAQRYGKHEYGAAL